MNSSVNLRIASFGNFNFIVSAGPCLHDYKMQMNSLWGPVLCQALGPPQLPSFFLKQCCSKAVLCPLALPRHALLFGPTGYSCSQLSRCKQPVGLSAFVTKDQNCAVQSGSWAQASGAGFPALHKVGMVLSSCNPRI